MAGLLFRGLFTILLIFTTSFCFAQCQYDIDNNGVINCGDDLFFHLLQFGAEDEETDHNENGVTDIRDILEMMPYKGSSDCDEAPEDISDHILGLVLQEVHVHDTAFTSVFDTVPQGAVTYRLYLELLDPLDVIVATFGDSISPMSISTPGSFYHTLVGSPTSVTPSNISPAIYNLVPTYAYDSWLTMDDAPGINDYIGTPSSQPIGVPDGWIEPFKEGGDILIDDLVGGGVFNYWVDSGDSPNPNLRLLGQFTVVGSNELSGQLNVQIQRSVFPVNVGQATLAFNLDDLAAFGCTNATAPNFDPEAQFDDGSCQILGDFNGDGVVSIDDILEFLTIFPCTLDCGDSDLDGDGIVNVQDILILLGLLTD